MTRPLPTPTASMDRLTPLESAVLAALADELSAVVPDLAGQIEEALPGRRHVTPEGFRTEIVVDRRRPSPPSGATGRLGTVHADVAPLEHPMAFHADFAGGRLIALTGATYGEDAAAIHFATARPEGLFTVDARGESVAWTPSLRPEDSPLRDLHTPDTPAPAAELAPTPSLADIIFGGPVQPRPSLMPLEPLTAQDRTSWVVGVWIVIPVVALLVAFAADIPWVLALIASVFLARQVQRPKVHDDLRSVWAATRARDR